jgi:hypothetical protein
MSTFISFSIIRIGFLLESVVMTAPCRGHYPIGIQECVKFSILFVLMTATVCFVGAIVKGLST